MDIVDSRKLDSTFKFQIANEPGEEGVLKCFSCESCTAHCPEKDEKTEWNPCFAIRKALARLKEEVLSSEFIWICSAHYSCLEKCHQGVDVKAVINTVRNARLRKEQREDATGKKAQKYLDLSFKYKIAEDTAEKSLFECFSCGTYIAGYPKRELDPLYSPWKIIKNILKGMKEEVFSIKFVEICATHHRCYTQCPHGVEIPQLMNAIQTIAIKEDYQNPAGIIENMNEKMKRNDGESKKKVC